MVIKAETGLHHGSAREETELVQYITDGILDCLDRTEVTVPSEAADDVFQLALLRQYVLTGCSAAAEDEPAP